MSLESLALDRKTTSPLATSFLSPSRSRPPRRSHSPCSCSHVLTLPRWVCSFALQVTCSVSFRFPFKPLTTNNIRRRLRAVLEEAGIEGVAPHAFRRTVAIVLDRAAGADLAAEMLGHTSSKVTKEHYIEPDEAVNLVTAEILEALASHRSDGER